VWAEPNMAILTFEIALSASWLIGSIIDVIQIVMRKREQQLEKGKM